MKVIKNLLTMFLVLFPLYAHALGEPYTQEKLDALNKEGKPTLVFIHADWCTTCKAQDKILGDLFHAKEFSGITTLQVDFDTQKSDLKKLNEQNRSTLIVFKAGKEVARVTGDTDRDRIAALLRTAL